MQKTSTVPNIRTKFLRVKCPSCGNEQVIFSAAASRVLCLACNSALAESTASKIRLNAKLVKIYE
ncbi:MAG: 30S ribosomal protein S27e [Candidatus Diapherotrites archaeon]